MTTLSTLNVIHLSFYFQSMRSIRKKQLTLSPIIMAMENNHLETKHIFQDPIFHFHDYQRKSKPTDCHSLLYCHQIIMGTFQNKCTNKSPLLPTKKTPQHLGVFFSPTHECQKICVSRQGLDHFPRDRCEEMFETTTFLAIWGQNPLKLEHEDASEKFSGYTSE